MRSLDVTKREKEMLRLLAQGYTNAEMAEALGLSKSSIHSYMTRLFNKFRVEHRVQLLLEALRTGSLGCGEVLKLWSERRKREEEA